MSANKVYKLTLSNNNIDATSSSRVIGVIFVFVRLYKVSSAYAVRFSVSGDTKAVLTVAILRQSLPPHRRMSTTWKWDLKKWPRRLYVDPLELLAPRINVVVEMLGSIPFFCFLNLGRNTPSQKFLMLLCVFDWLKSIRALLFTMWALAVTMAVAAMMTIVS